MAIYTTFLPTLRYSCDMERCDGCCGWFEEIEVTWQEVNALENAGYRDFYEKRGRKLLLRNPCAFLDGKLCKIHSKHGYAAKPAACKKHPFIVTLLSNGNLLVDVKQSCPCVGDEKGKALTNEYLEKEVLAHVDVKSLIPAPRKNVVFFHEQRGILIEWRTLEALYNFIGELLISTKAGAIEKILLLTAIVRFFAANCEALLRERGDTVLSLSDVSKLAKAFLQHFEAHGKESVLAELTHSSQLAFDPFLVSEIQGELLDNEKRILEAMKKLGIKNPINLNSDKLLHKKFSQEAENLHTQYLIQSLKETLARPWDFSTSYFWACGVMGAIDILARALAQGEEVKAEMRSAIRIIDYLNKSVENFREYIYPRYPELGARYVQYVIASGAASSE